MQKKTFLYLILSGFISCNISSQNNSLSGLSLLSPFPSPYGLEILDDKNLTFYWYSISPETADWDLKRDYTYSIEKYESNSYIQLSENIPEDLETSFYPDSNDIDWGNKIQFLYAKYKDPKEHFLNGELYYPSIFIGYTKSKNNSNSNTFILTFPNYESTSRVYKEASSSLSEYGIEYKIENLNNLEESTPWVEGVEGYGIGESFVIENSWGDTYKYLLIMNGYISATKPHLYSQNSRIKTILVEGVDSRISRKCNVEDTPHPQTVDISFIKDPEDLKITIVEVYEGSKYEDTAIQYLITFNDEVIPFRN